LSDTTTEAHLNHDGGEAKANGSGYIRRHDDPEAEQHLSLALQAAVAGFGNMVRADGTGRTRAAWTK
jgi:hypothetical protein